MGRVHHPGSDHIPGTVYSPFDVTCHIWNNVEERGKRFKVAAIPAGAEVQFLEGESMRGHTQVNYWSIGKLRKHTARQGAGGSVRVTPNRHRDALPWQRAMLSFRSACEMKAGRERPGPPACTA
jgi:hypothetical protein